MTGMQCPDCGETHTEWAEDGQHTVDGPYHAGIIQRWECGRCGGIVEGGQR